MDNNEILTTRTRKKGKRRAKQGIFAAVIFFIFAALILRQQVPAVDSWVEKRVSPHQWRAKSQCRHSALAAAQQKDFARIIKQGKIFETKGGFYIKGIVVGQMGQDGREMQYDFSCYVDSAGNVIKSHKQARTQQ